MNERIRQLAEQAANYANTYDDAGADIWFEMYNQKFAELLIKECYESCRSQVLDKETADTNELTYNDAVSDCAIGLLQHFGMME
jgi:hypothetical protein